MPFSSACFLHGSQPLTRPARALCALRLPSFGQAACVDMRVWLEHRGWKAMDSPRDWLRRVLSAPPPRGGLWPGGCGGHRTKRGPCGLIQMRESALMALPSHHGHWGEGWQQNHLLQEAPPWFCWARLLMAHLSHRP